MTGEVVAVEHPAKFSPEILAVVARFVRPTCIGPERMVLDPFAGVGTICRLACDGLHVECVELEAEWAQQIPIDPHVTVIVGDALEFMEASHVAGRYHYVVTSPAYGNRMADHHDAKDKSKRVTYKHKLGRELTPGNSGALQWGDEYRKFHRRAWRGVWEVLKPGGLFVLNVKDHIRKDERQGVPQWHRMAIERVGFKLLTERDVKVKGMLYGANREVRVETEKVFVFQKTNRPPPPDWMRTVAAERRLDASIQERLQRPFADMRES